MMARKLWLHHPVFVLKLDSLVVHGQVELQQPGVVVVVRDLDLRRRVLPEVAVLFEPPAVTSQPALLADTFGKRAAGGTRWQGTVA